MFVMFDTGVWEKASRISYRTSQNKVIIYVLHYDSRQHSTSLGYDDFVNVKYLSVGKRVDYWPT